MVGCNSYREPSVLAKITSTFDVISGGRLDWGIGAGWYENEYKGYGFKFLRPKKRIGMLREAVQIVRLPYHLSAVTQAVARTALAHTDELQAQVGLLRRERDDLVEWLRAHGFEAPESDANFIMFGMFDDRRTVWQGLLDRGVLIRMGGPDGWMRVSIGTPEENELFRTALLEATS